MCLVSIYFASSLPLQHFENIYGFIVLKMLCAYYLIKFKFNQIMGLDDASIYIMFIMYVVVGLHKNLFG